MDDLTSSYALLKERSDADAGESEDEEITDAEGERNERKSPSKELERNCKRREMSLSSYEAHCFVIFDLSVIAEIVTYKSSVVGVSRYFVAFSHPLDIFVSLIYPRQQNLTKSSSPNWCISGPLLKLFQVRMLNDQLCHSFISFKAAFFLYCEPNFNVALFVGMESKSTHL